jgi:hypothetical protein
VKGEASRAAVVNLNDPAIVSRCGWIVRKRAQMAVKVAALLHPDYSLYAAKDQAGDSSSSHYPWERSAK